jgi:hypothetical protein
MRCTVALQTCLALLLAFSVSPFEHAHTGAGADHDHGALKFKGHWRAS